PAHRGSPGPPRARTSRSARRSCRSPGTPGPSAAAGPSWRSPPLSSITHGGYYELRLYPVGVQIKGCAPLRRRALRPTGPHHGGGLRLGRGSQVAEVGAPPLSAGADGSEGGHAAVDAEDRAGRVCGLVAREVDGDAGDVLR